MTEQMKRGDVWKNSGQGAFGLHFPDWDARIHSAREDGIVEFVLVRERDRAEKLARSRLHLNDFLWTFKHP